MRKGDNSCSRSADREAPALSGRRRHSYRRTCPPSSRRRSQASHRRLRAFYRRRQGQHDDRSAFAEGIGADHFTAGIDTKNGRIAVKGWKAEVALTADEAIPQLEPLRPRLSLHTCRRRRNARRVSDRCRVAAPQVDTQSSSSLPEAFAASRRSTRSMQSAPMQWSAWPSTAICSLSDRSAERFMIRRCKPSIDFVGYSEI